MLNTQREKKKFESCTFKAKPIQFSKLPTPILRNKGNEILHKLAQNSLVTISVITYIKVGGKLNTLYSNYISWFRYIYE